MRRKDPVWIPTCGLGRGLHASSLVSEHRKIFFSFYSRERRNFTAMPLRRRNRQTLNPPKEWEMPRRRSRQLPDPPKARDVRDLRAGMDAMEITQRCTAGAGDLSDSESENEDEHEGEEVAAEDVTNERLLRVVARIGAREKVDIPVYEGNLDVEKLLDWIRALDTYFDYEDVEEDKKVKHVVTRLKGHATLWWDELQADRRCKGKQKIKIWDRMIANMKAKFIPKDYQITLFWRMQNLRQKLMSEKEYTEEFYKLSIRAGHHESDDEKVARYMNGLRYDIQDEMTMVTIGMVEDAYQMALKAEDKMSRKKIQRGRGRSQPRGKTIV
jgi:hypothetical protein